MGYAPPASLPSVSGTFTARDHVLAAPGDVFVSQLNQLAGAGEVTVTVTGRHHTMGSATVTWYVTVLSAWQVLLGVPKNSEICGQVICLLGVTVKVGAAETVETEHKTTAIAKITTSNDFFIFFTSFFFLFFNASIYPPLP